MPVYQMNWRLDMTKAVPGTFLHDLLATVLSNDETADKTFDWSDSTPVRWRG